MNDGDDGDDDDDDDDDDDRLKVIAAEPVIDFSDHAYQSQLADHQRSTAVQSIRNNLKATELQLCDSIATKRQLVSSYSLFISLYTCLFVSLCTCMYNAQQ